MDSYLKTYEDDIFFFIPMTIADEGDKKRKRNIEKEVFAKIKADVEKYKASNTDQNDYGDMYCEIVTEHVNYECNNPVFREVERLNLGKFTLACYDDDYDGTVLDTEQAHIIITTHQKTGLYIVTLAIHDNHYIPTQLIDQMSTDHLEILNEETGKYINVIEYMSEKYNLSLCGEAKCVVCLSKEPEDKTELGYLLSGETYVSEHIDYHIRDVRIKEMLRNRAIYDYYDSYISPSVIAFIFKEYSDDLEKRLERETSELFIVEIVLFQNTAVLRTNRRVVAELDESDGITNTEIEELYLEFGHTMRFWSADVFKYPFSQIEADEVINSFGIAQAREEYLRNQQFIDRLIELKGNIESERSNSRMNFILYVLAWIEGASILLSGLMLIFDMIGITHKFWWGLLSIGVCVFIAMFIYFTLISGKKITKKKKLK
ncbi:MAG: hypothetical protein IKD04_01730 [Clostridia bacterium]|nr:hypothetical protein [Clostridia bacterium]